MDAKISLIGPRGVGKTSLTRRFVDKAPPGNPDATIGAAFCESAVVIKDTKIKLQIWDTSGEERFRSLMPLFYRNAEGILLVYDLNDMGSFYMLKDIAKGVLKNVSSESVVLQVAGNKCDKGEIARRVPAREAEEFAREIGATHTFTSALLSTGVDEIFHSFAKRILEKHEENQTDEIDSEKIVQVNVPQSKGNTSCCSKG